MPTSKTEEIEVEAENNSNLFENWSGDEDNYVIIDREFYELTSSFELWEQLYKKKEEIYQDKIRKQLEKTDFLKMFTIVSDADRLGFTSKIVEYLKDQCPKRWISMTNLSDPEINNYNRQCFLPLIGSISSEVNILVDYNLTCPEYPFFTDNDLYKTLSPTLNSLFTPFILKNASCDEFFLRISQNNRSIFNLAYTLPLIDNQMCLNPETNILNYQHLNSEYEKLQNHINYCNNTFLKENSSKKEKIKKISQCRKKKQGQHLVESFVLKGNFNQFADYFKQKINTFQIKYLKGVLSAPSSSNLQFDQFYHSNYGKKVQSFPYHSVLFQNDFFGISIRDYLNYNTQKHHLDSQLVLQWRENVLAHADQFQQLEAEDSD